MHVVNVFSLQMSMYKLHVVSFVKGVLEESEIGNKMQCKQEKNGKSAFVYLPVLAKCIYVCHKFGTSHMDEQLSAAACGLMIPPLQASSNTLYEL